MRPSGNSSVPPPLQVLFLKVASSVSESQARIDTRVAKNPTRLKVQQPSAVSATAREPKALRNFKVPINVSSPLSSYSSLKAFGGVQTRSSNAAFERCSMVSLLFQRFHRLAISL